MKRISQTELLDLKILELKKQQNLELLDLKQQIIYTKESIKPSNLIKEGFTEVYHSVTNKNNLMANAVAILGGYFTRKAILGNSDSFIKKIAGSIIQFAIPNLINNLNTKTDEKNI
ncbi:hypothetical protein OX283_013690 [Flavobacterium sp. SUN052]|uniref:hypothetical protein n=1 Tax=Flavobacterium sp. SUN052 TaxID=3002441 RepID=UPI00237DBDBF|nr:hypothetical protein [Flavobacterium sp. SUN052]MEC4005718.1 hypothetical protein [Flavobacterium sp. SUN052]